MENINKEERPREIIDYKPVIFHMSFLYAFLFFCNLVVIFLQLSLRILLFGAYTWTLHLESAMNITPELAAFVYIVFG